MHQLYMHYLSCKGQWAKPTLTINVKKSTATEGEERYEWWDKLRMVAELGEDLAMDLIARHRDAESKLPAHRKGQFIKVSCAAFSS